MSASTTQKFAFKDRASVVQRAAVLSGLYTLQKLWPRNRKLRHIASHDQQLSAFGDRRVQERACATMMPTSFSALRAVRMTFVTISISSGRLS